MKWTVIDQKDAKEYEDWKHWRFPHLLETLEEFPSIDIDAALLVSQLPLLQPRFYSISSSPIIEADQIDITAAVISFNTQGFPFSNIDTNIKNNNITEIIVRW